MPHCWFCLLFRRRKKEAERGRMSVSQCHIKEFHPEPHKCRYLRGIAGQTALFLVIVLTPLSSLRGSETFLRLLPPPIWWWKPQVGSWVIIQKQMQGNLEVTFLRERLFPRFRSRCSMRRKGPRSKLPSIAYKEGDKDSCRIIYSRDYKTPWCSLGPAPCQRLESSKWTIPDSNQTERSSARKRASFFPTSRSFYVELPQPAVPCLFPCCILGPSPTCLPGLTSENT